MKISNRLLTLADEARRAHNEALHHAQEAADRAITAGAALNEAKALCAYGTWGDWLANTGIPERSARRYMKLHRAGCNSAIVADMGVVAAERIATLGLQITPKNSAGAEAIASNADGSTAYALTRPENEGAIRYFACYNFADPELDFFLMRECVLPIALGILHSAFADCFDSHRSRRMTPTETAQARAKVGGVP